jgi:hypothetical protein
VAVPQYKYGKVTGLFPDLTVVSERAESPMVCCGYCATHMACITARTGLSTKMENEAHAIRSAGGRAHNAGSRRSEERAGASKALGITLLNIAIADIPDRLAKGFSVVVAVQYARLPDWIKVQANDFGHAVTLFGYDVGRVGFFDPLWDQGARGAWTPWPSVLNALWENGNHNTTTVRLMTVAGGDYIIYDDQVTSLKLGDVAPETDFFNDWAMTERRGAIGVNGGRVQIMGYRGSSLAIQINSSQGWTDGISRPTLVYVPKSKVTNIIDTVPPSTVGCTPEEVLAAEQRGYDLALSAFPPRPS